MGAGGEGNFFSGREVDVFVEGDVLVEGLRPVDAAVLGVSLHARAGRFAAMRLTDISVTSEDVIEAIPEAILDLAG